MVSKSPPSPTNSGCRRIVAVSGLALTALFALQTIAAAFSIPVFREMFADFATPPPAPTRVVMQLRFLWLALALAEAAAGSFLFFQQKPSRRRDAALAGLALISGGLSLAITAAMFLPVFQLARPSATP